MKTWTVIELNDTVNVDLSIEDLGLFETSVVGWSKEDDFYELTPLITIIVTACGPLVHTDTLYLHPDAKLNVTARSLAKQAERQLILKAQTYMQHVRKHT